MSVKPPAKVDATGELIEFVYDGQPYAVPPASAWDLEALDAFEDNKVSTCVRLILGEAQWKTFRAKRRTVGDLNGIFEEINTRIASGN